MHSFFQSEQTNINITPIVPINSELEDRLIKISAEHKFKRGLGVCYFLNPTDSPPIEVIAMLKNGGLKSSTKENSSNAALIFGDGYFLSLAPELLKNGVNIIFLCDIEFDLAWHTRHLLTCLMQSKTKEEFEENYLKNHFLKNTTSDGMHSPHKLLEEIKQHGTRPDLHTNEIFKQHFLSTKERFLECKAAVAALHFAWAYVDIFSAGSSKSFARCLLKYGIHVALLNFTNIRDYDTRKNMTSATQHLLDLNPNAIVLEAGLYLEKVGHLFCRKMEEYKKSYKYFPSSTPALSTIFLPIDDIMINRIPLTQPLNIAFEKIMEYFKKLDPNAPIKYSASGTFDDYRYGSTFVNKQTATAIILENLKNSHWIGAFLLGLDDNCMLTHYSKDEFIEVMIKLQLPTDLYSSLQKSLKETKYALPDQLMQDMTDNNEQQSKMSYLS